MAWNASNPANDELLTNFPAQCRANWDAIALMTDAALLITNAKCSPSMGLVDTKLAQITTAGKVSGAALTGLASIPIGAGVIPAGNLSSVAQKGGNSDITSLSGLTTPLSVAQGGTGMATAANAINNLLPNQSGQAGKALVTDGSVCSWGFLTFLILSDTPSSYSGQELAYLRVNAGANAVEFIANPFNTSSGHDHDGSDSKKVLATNLDMTGISSGHVLYNNSGTLAGQAFPGQTILNFRWVTDQDTNHGMYMGTSTNPGITGNNLFYTCVADSSAGGWTTMAYLGKWIKNATVSSVTTYVLGWGTSTSGTNFKFYIGTANATILANTTSAGTYYNGSIDVSSLTNGTAYDIYVQVRHAGASDVKTAYMAGVTMIGN